MDMLENQTAAESVDLVFQDLEAMLMRNIIRHCQDYDQPIATDTWLLQKLAELGRLDQENIKLIAQMTGLSQTAMERMLSESADEALKQVEPALAYLTREGLAGKPVKLQKSKHVQNTMKDMKAQAKSTLNLCNTNMLYKAREAYQKLVNKVAADASEIANKQSFLDRLNVHGTAVTIGAESRQQAMRRCIEEFNDKGIPAFVDKRGREWTPEAYVNMAMRNTAKNTADEVQTARCRDYGVNLIEIDSHSGARPKCAKDQGKIYDLNNGSGYTTDAKGRKVQYYPWNSTSYGEPDGILGINCRHHKYPFFPGMSLQTYFPVEDQEASDRLYKQTQVQRALERDVRKQKRECMLYKELGDDEAFEQSAVKLKAKEARLRNYVGDNDQLHRRKDREQVVGFDRKISAEAVAANKKVQKMLAEKARDDKIKAEIKASGLQGEIDLHPKIPDVKELSFDGQHVNQERQHNVTEEEAKNYIQNAVFSTTKWKGKFTNYYSSEGAAFVDNNSKHIRTAFKKEQYDDAAKAAMEVLKRGWS